MNFIYSKINQLVNQLPVPTTFILPDKHVITTAQQPSRLTITLHTRMSFIHLLNRQIGAIGSDYVEGKIDIEGNMRDVMACATALINSGNNSPYIAPKIQWLTNTIRHIRSQMQHTLGKDAKQIEHHYDVSDDFYKLWLDPMRVYSCAYYPNSNYSLAEAQQAKLDLICRKLDLHNNERFLDIGAGWGGLLLWAAKQYGVKATGITLSKNQYAYVNQLINEQGLQNQVQMLLCDYRTLKVPQFDKIASVGMFEHVGLAHMTDYFTILCNLLKPGGLFLNHGITAGGTGNNKMGYGMGDFIEKYIFPGGELIHISDVMETLTNAGLESLDVENLRPHYAKTLWAWSDSLEHQLDKASKFTDAQTIKAYRLYLAGSAMCFEQGWISVYQVLGANPDHLLDSFAQINGLIGAQSGYPFSRDYIYNQETNSH